MKIKITNISTICTWSPAEDKLLILSDVEILVEDSTIIQISKTVGGAEEEIDADGALITPGFVDSHTHPIFSGNRANEFSMRISGKSYEEIASMGGGIISSINEVRNASEEQLLEECLERINFFLVHGTTTIEAKSGYGLTIEDELKSLKVIKRLNESSPLDIIPTFMGAHAFPPEFKNDHGGYVRLICEEMIPVVAEEKLAEFCDVFCENGYFSVEQSKRVLETGIKYGLKPRLHADEFLDSGAAELAAEIGAVSADHLMAVSDLGINSPITLREIYDLLEKKNLQPIDPLIAINARFHYDEQPKGEWLRMAVPLDSMIDSDGIPHLPKLGQGLNLLFLETYWSYPGAIFHPHNDFVVQKKP